MRYRMKARYGDWTLTDTETGEVVLSGQGYEVTSEVEYRLNSGRFGSSECGEVARNISRRSSLNG